MTYQASSRWQILLSLVLIYVPPEVQAGLFGTAPDFLYDNGTEAFPIIEYMDEHTDEFQMPPFVEESDKEDRVVKFYSPTCPHCVHFKPTYINFARAFENMTQHDTLYKGMKVKFYAVSCQKYKKVCRKQSVSSYPTLKIYSGKTGHVEAITGSLLHPLTIIKALDPTRAKDPIDQRAMDQQAQQNRAVEEIPQPIIDKSNAPPFLPRTQKEAFQDAYLTFYNAMRDSVFLEDGPLPHKRGLAMRQWLHLLDRVLPPWRVGWIVRELDKDFKNNAAVEKQWTSVVEMYPPAQKNWSPACQLHDSPYTCGLWTLLHIVTVGVVEYNLQIPHSENIKTYQTKIQDISSAAIMIREYVKNFFLCEECSTHFVQAFDACEYRRCQRLTHNRFTYNEWRELPLWLLDFHNGVNIRLQRERFLREGRTEPPTKEEEESVLWPPVSECPYCWVHRDGAKSEYTLELTYRYMRLVYWPEDGASAITRRQLAADRIEYEKSPHGSKSYSNPHADSELGGMTMDIDLKAEFPYMLVTGLVCGVWLVVLFKKYRLDVQLGIRRAKMKQ